MTGLPEPTFPEGRRKWLQFGSATTIAIFLFLVICSVISQIVFTLYMNRYSSLQAGEISILAGFLGLVLVLILQRLYRPVALWLNNRENYRTDSQYDNGLILKRWLFDFVNVFSRLFY